MEGTQASKRGGFGPRETKGVTHYFFSRNWGNRLEMSLVAPSVEQENIKDNGLMAIEEGVLGRMMAFALNIAAIFEP